MSYTPDDRHERESLPQRIANPNVTINKEKYDKNTIRSPQPTEAVNIYDPQNFKKSTPSRQIAPASVPHAALNQPGQFLPHGFGPMYSQMSSIMMQPAVPYLRPDYPYTRHIMPLQVTATTGVPPRPPLGQPGRGIAPSVGHHLKQAGLPNQVHTISTHPLSLHPSTNLKQTRSPSPQTPQEVSAEVPKGEMKSQAIPTEARNVNENRPAVLSSEAAAPTARVSMTPMTINTSSKSATLTSNVKNPLGLTSQAVGIPVFGKQLNTATPQISTSERTSIARVSSMGQPSVATSNFIPKMISHVGQPATIGTLYSQPPTVSFSSRPQQIPERFLKPNTAISSGSFVSHTATLSTVGSAAVPTMTNARVEAHRSHPFSFPYFDTHSALQPYVPIESIVRKPTTIVSPNHISSSAHVTTGLNPALQLMASHSNAPSVTVMGVPLQNSSTNIESTNVPKNVQQSSSIFSVQNMLSTTQSSSSSSSNVTSSSPRPTILRKRPEVTRKPPSQQSSGDSIVVIPANDVTASPRLDSNSRQNSPKSDLVLNKENKTVVSKVKRELIPSTSSSTSPTVNHTSTSVMSSDVAASPRKKPRKQNVVATEDKYSSNNHMQVELNDMTNSLNEKSDQEEDEEMKFLLSKRHCVSIYGRYKVNDKTPQNHFQRYSDVKPKDERKPTLQEIANERSITQRATGWKIQHVGAQIDELRACEEDVLRKMCEFRDRLPKYKPGHKRYDEMVMLHELLQGNIQRSQLVIEQLGETKKTTVKILDHKSSILDIIQKNIKRNGRKKS